MTTPRPETLEREKDKPPMTDRLAYRVPEVCAMLGISRWTLYRDAKAGKIQIEKRGRMSFVFREALESYRSASFTCQPQAQPIFDGAIPGNSTQPPATRDSAKPARKQRLRARHATHSNITQP